MEITPRGCDVYFKLSGSSGDVLELGKTDKNFLKGIKGGYFNGVYIQDVKESELDENLIANLRRVTL